MQFKSLLAIICTVISFSFTQIIGSLYEYTGDVVIRTQENGTGLIAARPMVSMSAIGFLWGGLFSENFIIGDHIGAGFAAGTGFGVYFQFGGKMAYKINEEMDIGFKHIWRDFRSTGGENELKMRNNFFNFRYQSYLAEIGFNYKADPKAAVPEVTTPYSSIELRYMLNEIKQGEENGFVGIRFESYTPAEGKSITNGKTTTISLVIGSML
jgi:hypothetical protein